MLEFFFVGLVEFGWSGACRFTVGNFEDASAGAVDAGVFVAFASVGPIEDEHGAVWAGGEFDAAEEGVF